MSCDVGPGSFATTRMPSTCGRAGLSVSRVAASATIRAEHPACLVQHQRHRPVERLVQSGASGSGVTAATERHGQGGRVEAAVAGTNADLGSLLVLAEQDHEGTLSGLAEQVAQALGILSRGSGGYEIFVRDGGPYEPAVELVLQPIQGTTEQ